MNSEEIKKYVNGHVELMAETLLDECRDWTSFYSAYYEKKKGCSIFSALNAQHSDWFSEGRSIDEVERASLRMARKIAAQTVSEAIGDGRTLNLRLSQSFGNFVFIDDEQGCAVLSFSL